MVELTRTQRIIMDLENRLFYIQEDIKDFNINLGKKIRNLTKQITKLERMIKK